MSNIQYLQSFIRYKAWTNVQLFKWLSQLTEEELLVQRDTVFRNILGTVYHSYAMDVVWRAHLEGKSHEYTTDKPEATTTLPKLNQAQAELDNWYIQYVDNLNFTEFDEMVEFSFISGKPGVMSRGDILLHVVNHGTYHRAHIDIIYPISVAPPITDFPVFLCREK